MTHTRAGAGRTAGGKRAAPWIVITGLDGSGKTTLAERLAAASGARLFRLPYHDFVKSALTRSGYGDPFGDVHTDRLIFAADARLTDYLIQDWRQSHPCLVSQRGWMDSFVFGAVQGLSYAETDALLRTQELERASAVIHLVAEAEIAYARIRRDPDADKYETLQFMRRQAMATREFYRAARSGSPVLAAFAGIPATLIDTSRLSIEEVYRRAVRFLRDRLPEWRSLTAPPRCKFAGHPRSPGCRRSGASRGR